MGSHRRYQGAILIAALLLIVSAQANAATRQYVTVPPAGAAVKSNTGLPVTSGGVLRVDGPLQGEYIPRTGSGTKGVPIKVQPRYDFSIPRTINHAKNGLRAGWPGMAAAVGIGLALDQVDAFLTPEGPVVPVYDPVPGRIWSVSQFSPPKYTGATPEAACRAYLADAVGNVEYFHSIVLTGGSFANCWWSPRVPSRAELATGVSLLDPNCPVGSEVDPSTGGCRVSVGTRPLSEVEYDLIGDFMTQQNAEWLRDLLRDVCEAGPNPPSCYEAMLERTALNGPATVPGPTTTSTTTTTAADGTQQQTTTTTKTEYNIRYGDSYFDYSERKTSIVTHPDGSTTEEVTAEPETETPSQEEPAYSFQDSEFPEVAPFYEQKYPDGLQGVWANASAQLNNSAFMSFLNSFVPTFSGSCPSWSMSFDIASWASYGTHNFPSLCYVFDFIKVIILVSAAFLCRAIIFGG